MRYLIPFLGLSAFTLWVMGHGKLSVVMLVVFMFVLFKRWDEPGL